MERSHELFVSHYAHNYDGYYPVWVAVEVLSFGTLSKSLFRAMNNADQKEIARRLGIKSERVLASFLQALTVLRNTTAHHSRLYGKSFTNACAILKSDQKLLASHQICINPQTLFAFTLALLHLVPAPEKVELVNELRVFATNNPNYNLAACGFPENWGQLLAGLQN